MRCPQAAKTDSTRCHAVRRGPAAGPPPTGGPRSTALPRPDEESGVRIVGPVLREGEEDKPESPVPRSLHVSRLSGRRAGLVEPPRTDLALRPPAARL